MSAEQFKKQNKPKTGSESMDDEDDLYTTAEDSDEEIQYQSTLVGNVIQVKSLENFYFQVYDSENQLMNMQRILDNTSLHKPFEKIPPIGSLCICKYKVDKGDQFYRAQVIENSDMTMLKVFYIDYGNEDYVNIAEIFKMESELKIIPPLAINCSLYFTNKFNNIIKLLSQNANVTSNLQQQISDKSMIGFSKQHVSSTFSSTMTNNLIKCFKNLTGNTKITVKIRKQVTYNSMQTNNTKAILVDMFLGQLERNSSVKNMFSSFCFNVTKNYN